MLVVVSFLLALVGSLSDAALVPGIFGPGTGSCGPITVLYGTSGSGSHLQAFVAPAPLPPTALNTVCTPTSSDTYTYTLGPSGLPSYTLAPALRKIGTNISPALGYFDTPALNFATATPLAGAPPTPIPAGTYDAGIVYKPSSANTQCLNGSSTEQSAFLIQAPTATSVTGSATTPSGAPYTLLVNVTYSTAAVQLPFSDPAAVSQGILQVATGSTSPQILKGTATVTSTGPGVVTYSFTPDQPLATGAYTVSATYTPSANFLIASTSSAFSFTVTPALTSPPPTTTATPTTTAAPTTSANPATTATPTTTAKPSTTNAPATSTRAPATTTRAPATTTKRPPTTTPRPTTTKPPKTPPPSPLQMCCAMGFSFCCG
ncbi:g5596 [Coccomyxa viridis]|uniref:G5596 protein n=1 Tax=Coccomyxa viridis TaxID=1274662 RepID=A0ABP1FVR6_9CHLO